MVRLIIASLLVAFVAAEGVHAVDPLLMLGGEDEGRVLADNENFMILKDRQLIGKEGEGHELVDNENFMILKDRQLLGKEGEGRELIGNENFMILKDHQLLGKEGEGRELIGNDNFMILKDRQLIGDVEFNGGRKLTRMVDPMLSPLKGRELTRVVDPMLSPLEVRQLSHMMDPMMSPIEARELTGNKNDRRKLTRVVDPMLSPLKGRELTHVVDPMISPLEGRQLMRMVDPMLSPLKGRELTGADEGRKLTRVVDPMLSPLEGRQLIGDDQCSKTCDSEKVRYKSLCRGIARRPGVTTRQSLLDAALRLAASKTKAAKGKFAEEAAKAAKKGSPAMASILESCAKSYGDVLSGLEDARRSIDGRASRATLLSQLSAASTYATDCDNWFDEREVKSPYKRMQTHVARVVANTLGIASVDKL